MSSGFEFNAQCRSTTGKAEARRMRHAGLVPGVIYGAAKDPQMITLPHDAILHALEHEAFHSHILKITLDNGNTEQVVLKDVQRHAYKPKIAHVDFYRVSAKQKLTMRVPLHYLGEEEAVGVKDGGVVSKLLMDLEIKCLPTDLPEYIEVDITELGMDHALHLSDIKLPKGVVLAHEIEDEAHDHPVVSIHMPKVSKEEVDAEAAAEAEAAAAAEGETAEAAPAAEGEQAAEGGEAAAEDKAGDAES